MTMTMTMTPTPTMPDPVVTELEVLYAARGSLDPDSGEVFDFDNWTSCTCGHLYGATTGVRPTADARGNQFVPLGNKLNAEQRALYERALAAVVRGGHGEALVPLVEASRTRALALTVSEMTSNLAEAEIEGHDRRLAALRLVTDAIERIEADQTRARLSVLNQEA